VLTTSNIDSPISPVLGLALCHKKTSYGQNHCRHLPKNRADPPGGSGETSRRVRTGHATTLPCAPFYSPSLRAIARD
jgi:hypothetical protein